MFGLVTYIAENRIKEIGVRKLLGASVSSIATLLSKDFIKLVIIAIVIASPVAWWAMNKWLQSFTYRVIIGWWVFALAGLFGNNYCIGNNKFPGNKSSNSKPGEEFENGMINVNGSIVSNSSQLTARSSWLAALKSYIINRLLCLKIISN